MMLGCDREARDPQSLARRSSRNQTKGSAGRTMKPDVPPRTVDLVGLAAALAILRYFRSILWPLAAAFVITVLIFALVGRIVRAFPRAPRWSVILGTALAVAVLLLAAVSEAAAG